MFLQSVPPASLNLFGEVLKLIKLLLVCPASAATAERSFSDLRRLKRWLRSSISQEQLIHVAILHAHQLYVDKHAAEVLRAVLSEFISETEKRKNGKVNLVYLVHIELNCRTVQCNSAVIYVLCV